MTIFLSKSVKFTLGGFLGYFYDLANFHPDILIEAILINKRVCKKILTLTYFTHRVDVFLTTHVLNNLIVHQITKLAILKNANVPMMKLTEKYA